MAVRARVRREPFSDKGEAIISFGKMGEGYFVDLVRDKWQLFEYADDYNENSGGITVKGKVVRRYDPNAGEQEGKPGRWDTKEEAIAYYRRWIEPHIKR
jgi:hypothetical protein